VKQTRRSRSLAVRELDQFVVVVTVRTPLSDAEWDEYVQLYRSAKTRTKRVLMHCAAAPNAAQRGRLRNAEGRAPCLEAVIAVTRDARTAAIAMNWFNPRMRLFGHSELESALDYLGAAGGDRELLHRTLDELEKELTAPPPKSVPELTPDAALESR